MIADEQRRQAIEEELRRKYDAQREAACRLREWMSRELHHMEPEPGQRSDTHLEPYIGWSSLAKGMDVFLVKGDVEAAERLAKATGLPFDQCLKAFSDVNRLNIPSFQGGDLIQKGANMKSKKSMKKAKKLLRRGKEMLANMHKASTPQYSPSAAQVLRDIEAADALRRDPRVDQQAAFGRQMQAAAVVGPELIKAVRANPGNRRQVI